MWWANYRPAVPWEPSVANVHTLWWLITNEKRNGGQVPFLELTMMIFPWKESRCVRVESVAPAGTNRRNELAFFPCWFISQHPRAYLSLNFHRVPADFFISLVRIFATFCSPYQHILRNENIFFIFPNIGCVLIRCKLRTRIHFNSSLNTTIFLSVIVFNGVNQSRKRVHVNYRSFSRPFYRLLTASIT